MTPKSAERAPELTIIGDGKLTEKSRWVLGHYKQAPFLHTRTMSAQEMRKAFDDFYAPIDLPKEDVSGIEDKTIEGPYGPIAVRLYRPVGADERPLPICLYYHGGGLALGSIRSFDSLCRRLCNAAEAIVAFVDYRMIPENKFPAAIDDAYAAVRWAREQGHAIGCLPDRIAVAGDSAGGNLAAGSAQLARADGIALRSQVLIYPAVGNKRPSKSAELYSSGYFFEPEDMAWFYASYLDDIDQLRDPRVSPILADDLSDLADAFILTAGFDGLRDDAEHYGELLAEAGVTVKTHRYSSNLHGFLNMGGLIEEAGIAIDDCGRALKCAFVKEN